MSMIQAARITTDSLTIRTIVADLTIEMHPESLTELLETLKALAELNGKAHTSDELMGRVRAICTEYDLSYTTHVTLH